MDKYSRYTDEKGRLFVLLAKWGSPEKEGDKITIKPGHVDLLDVHAEKMNEMPVIDFERYVQKGLLKRVK